MSNKLVVVLGATGNQGGSVIRALLQHGGYSICGITRNPDAPAAKALKDQGVKVISADLVDKDSLIKSFEGAYAVFGVTVPFTKDSEELQGRNIVDAAKAAKVPLLVWSSLPSATDTSKGKYTTIVHFDQKSEVDKYIATAGQPAVIVYTGGFAENLVKFQQLRQDATNPNKWNLIFPVLGADTHIPGIWIEKDLGSIVVGVIDHWEEKSLKERLTKEPIIAAPYTISPNEMVEILSRVTGKEVAYVQLSDVPEVQKAAYEWANEGFYTMTSDSKLLEELGVKTHTFEDYARAVVVPYLEAQQ